MKAQRHLALCAAVYLIVLSGCVASSSKNGSPSTTNDTIAADSVSSVDAATAVDAVMDDTSTPSAQDTTPAVEDTFVAEDIAVNDVAPLEDAGGEEDASAVVFDDGYTIPTPGLAACDNKDDVYKLAENEAALTETMKNCALNCLGEEACATDCVIKETGFSEACSACFGANIACTMKNCALQCMNPNNEKCATCQAENCNDDFTDCAGITVPGS